MEPTPTFSVARGPALYYATDAEFPVVLRIDDEHFTWANRRDRVLLRALLDLAYHALDEAEANGD